MKEKEQNSWKIKQKTGRPDKNTEASVSILQK